MTSTRRQPGIDFSDYVTERTQDFTGREWVFAEIEDWLADPDGERVFLLTGEPGSGKTAVAARLAQFAHSTISPPTGLGLLTRGFLSAVHFCSASDRRWINPQVFAQSLALQLAARYPVYATALAALSGDRQIRIDVSQQAQDVSGQMTGVVIEHLDVGDVSAEDAFIRVIREPLEALYQGDFAEPIVILVDALDAALQYSGEVGIVDLLAQTAHLPNHVRFVLTSRQEERVESRFLDAGGLYLSAAEHDERNRTDIRDYVSHRLHCEPALQDAVATVPAPQIGPIMTTICDKASGNFLYVRFLLDAVAEGRRALGDVEGLPQGFDGLYLDSLVRVVALGKQDWGTVYAPLLGVLSVAQESLTLEQLAAFTGQAEEKVWAARNDLGQFIEEIRPAGAVEEMYRLYHQSVSDFLFKRILIITQKDKTKRVPNRYWLSAEVWHDRIIQHFRSAETWAAVDWSRVDDYGLRYLVHHISQLRGTDDFREQLHSLLEAKEFIDRRLEDLADSGSVLEDLRIALDLALKDDDLERIWKHVLEYRRVLNELMDIERVINAVNEDQYELAQTRTAPYGSLPNAQTLVRLWIAWQAIARGFPQEALRVTQQALDQLPPRSVTHPAERLASTYAADAVSDAWS